MSDNELFDLAQKGNDSALATLYENNKNLIYSLMKRFHYSSEDKEDIFQVGALGLIKAIQNFDQSFGVQFSTYAVPIILGEIRKFFREQSGIKVSRGLRETCALVLKASDEFSDEHNREPTISELSQILDLPSEDIVLALESSYKPLSLEKKIDEEDENSAQIQDSLGEDVKDVIENYLDIDLALQVLDKREKLFVHLRFYENMTQAEIAKRLFTSQVNVSRLEKRVLKKMRERLLNYSK